MRRPWPWPSTAPDRAARCPSIGRHVHVPPASVLRIPESCRAAVRSDGVVWCATVPGVSFPRRISPSVASVRGRPAPSASASTRISASSHVSTPPCHIRERERPGYHWLDRHPPRAVVKKLAIFCLPVWFRPTSRPRIAHRSLSLHWTFSCPVYLLLCTRMFGLLTPLACLIAKLSSSDDPSSFPLYSAVLVPDMQIFWLACVCLWFAIRS